MADNSESREHATRLLQQAGAMRGLARSLIGDRDAATEAAHEVWLSSSAHEGESSDSDRYLRSAMRNRLRDRRRKDERRTRREHEAVEQRALVAAADDVAVQAEVRQRVIEAATSLAEPIRTTIWLRFFEDLPPRVISKRMAVPVNTVRSRVRLGVEHLRRRLDDLYDGDRKRWQRALLPATGWSLAAAAVPVLGLATGNKALLVVGAIAVALLGGGAALGWGRAEPEPVIESVAPVAEVRHEAPSDQVVGDARIDASSPPASTAFTLRGAIDLRRKSDGSRVMPGNGRLILSHSESEDMHVVDVVDGRFELALPRTATVQVFELRLDEWSIQAGTPEWQCSAEHAEVEYEVTAYPKGQLLVLDAATWAPLDGVDVYVGIDPPGDVPTSHPWIPDWSLRHWRENGSSPLALNGTRQEGHWFVSARGYAWERVAIDYEHGGERLVFLEPGGDVEITINKAPARRPMFLRIRDADGSCIRERPLADLHPSQLTDAMSGFRLLPTGELMARFRRLPTGELAASIEFGDRRAAPPRRHAIAANHVKITAGGCAQVVLDCTGESPRAGPYRDLEGSVLAGKAWGKPYGQIWMIPTDRAPLQGEIESTGTDHHAWSIGQRDPFRCEGLLPGHYKLLVTGLGIEREVEIPADGPVPRVDIVAPEPVQSEVLVTERGSNAMRHVSSAYLMHHGPDGVDRFFVRGSYIDGKRKRFLSLPGDYRIRAYAPGIVEADGVVVAGARNELFADAVRGGTLLQFRCQEARVPVDPKLVRLTSDVEGARVLQCLDVGFELSTHVSHAGNWRLRADVPGYQPVDCKVDMGGDWRQTVIPLVRK